MTENYAENIFALIWNDDDDKQLSQSTGLYEEILQSDFYVCLPEDQMTQVNKFMQSAILTDSIAINNHGAITIVSRVAKDSFEVEKRAMPVAIQIRDAMLYTRDESGAYIHGIVKFKNFHYMMVQVAQFQACFQMLSEKHIDLLNRNLPLICPACTAENCDECEMEFEAKGIICDCGCQNHCDECFQTLQNCDCEEYA